MSGMRVQAQDFNSYCSTMSGSRSDLTAVNRYAATHIVERKLLNSSLTNLPSYEAFNLWEKYPWKIECFLEDLFLGSQWSIILGYRRLSVKSLMNEPRIRLTIVNLPRTRTDAIALLDHHTQKKKKKPVVIQ